MIPFYSLLTHADGAHDERTGPMPPWANTSLGRERPTELFRRCVPCEVEFYSNDPTCWACGGAA